VSARPHPVLRRRIALSLAALLVAAGVLAVPRPPVADAAASTTLHGTVTVAGHAVAGVAVGTWSASRGTLATAKTDARGRFTLHSPARSSVVAWVGLRPSSPKAVFTAGDDHLVRGVIGRSAPAHVASALAQRVTPARPAALGGGHALRFRLQEAGRFVASSPLLGDEGDITDFGILLLQGGLATTSYQADSTDTVRSGWLVPGRYALEWVPNAGHLRARSTAVVRAGATVTAAPPAFTEGGSIRLQVTSGGVPVAAGVPAVQRIDGSPTQGTASTDASGAIVEHGLTPGTYAITVGQRYSASDDDFDGDPTSDVVLPKTVTLHVTGSAESTATVDLTPAGHVTGTASGPDGVVEVYAENASRVVVRRAEVEDGAFTLGGLPAGTYRVYAANRASFTYDVVSVVVPKPVGATPAPVALSRPLVPNRVMPTLKGHVSGGRSGAVSLRDTYPILAQPLAGATLGKSGNYRLRTVPGRFRVTITMEGRVRRTVQDVDVLRSTTKSFSPGPRVGKVVAQLTAHGRPLQAVLAFSTATGAEPTELDPSGRPGRVLTEDVAPGRYSTRSFLTVPAADGPWAFTAAKRTFRVHAGAVTRLGTIRVTIRG
jgi:hypothetical protein